MNGTFDTYLQKLLATGNIDECFVGVNSYSIPILSEDPETPPTYETKHVLVLMSEDGVRYGITEEQLELEKNAMISKYPEYEKTVTANYNILKSRMEV